MADNPNTLPADFFSQGNVQQNPDTLPADFFAARGGGAGAASRGGRNPGGGQTDPSASKLNGNAITDVLGGIADTAVRTVPAAARMAGHAVMAGLPFGNTAPLQKDLGNLVNAQVDQGKKAADAWKRGEHVEAFGHGMAAALPVVGPAAANAGETIGGELEYGDPQHPERATGVVREPQVARGIGQGIGLVVSSSPKNIVEPVATGVARAVGKIPIPERLTPEGLYQSSLRPSLAKKNLPKVETQVSTGLREGIPVSRKGLEQTRATIDDLNAEIADRLRGKSDELGPTISPKHVASRVEGVRQEFDTVNPESDQAAISGSKAEFLRKHSYEAPYTKIAPMVDEGEGFSPVGEGSTTVEKPLTLSEAQSEKQRTYTQLRKKYGELGSSTVEAQKNLARGLKEEIVKRVPELAGLNARDGALIELEGQLEKMVAREGNKNVLGLVPATMAHNPFGFLATLMMDNPAIKSRVAIALDRARNSITAPSIGRAAAAASIGGRIGGGMTAPPPYRIPGDQQ